MTIIGSAFRLLVGAILLAAPILPVVAHDGGATAFARITLSGQSVRYGLTIPDAASQSIAARLRDGGDDRSYQVLGRALREHVHLSSDGQTCAAGLTHVVPPSANSVSLTFTIDFACPPLMRTFNVRDDSFDILGSELHILARIEGNGAGEQFALASERREARVTLAEGPAPAAGAGTGPAGDAGTALTRGVGSFFMLGIEHILTGYDHLLFLLALMIGGGSPWSLVKIVTAFTVAHSVTLTAAALDLVVLPSRLVESAIALSIVYVALENIFLRQSAGSKRWLVALVFGLVHGFGFSAVLKELGLPADGLAWALLSFNLGVEAGQAFVVVAAIPALIGLQRASWRPRAVGLASLAVLVVGVVLVLERALS